MRLLVALFAALFLSLSSASAFAEPSRRARRRRACEHRPSAASARSPPPPAAPAGAFDPAAATRVYLDTVPADAHARSDAYFEGGYWLILVNFLATSAIALLVLHTGWSAAMRDRARRVSRVGFVRSALYWLQFYRRRLAPLLPALRLHRVRSRARRYGLSNT